MCSPRYWRQTLIKAVAARELSERLWLVPGDEPFLAGLVQDIGVLALIQQLGEPYLKLAQSCTDPRRLAVVAASWRCSASIISILSARLLSHWGLPAGLCAAISVPPDEARINELTKNEHTSRACCTWPICLLA